MILEALCLPNKPVLRAAPTSLKRHPLPSGWRHIGQPLTRPTR